VPFAAAGETGLYIEQVPPGRSGRPSPVVFDLHGYVETAAEQANVSALGTYGATHGFVTITPQVTYAVPHWQVTASAADLSFLSDLLTHVEATLCTDEARIYFTGYSNGAMMTSRVACALSTKVAAVAPVAGVQDYPDCHSRRPVPVVAFHGTADPYVNYEGGPGPKLYGLPAADGPGTLGQAAAKNPGVLTLLPATIPAQVAGWAKRNDCRPNPNRRAIGTDVTQITYRCPADAAVELYRVNGGGHTWPGSRVSASLAAATGRTTFTISADTTMWKFFQTHPLP
jgi:polyhydroxybutyrate depolymerase